jgi:hypothetical protein
MVYSSKLAMIDIRTLFSKNAPLQLIKLSCVVRLCMGVGKRTFRPSQSWQNPPYVVSTPKATKTST